MKPHRTTEISLLPKQAEPVKRWISGSNHGEPAPLCVGPSGQIEPSYDGSSLWLNEDSDWTSYE